jgi:hypothetical protein
VETLQEETLRCQSEMVTPPLPPRLSLSSCPPPPQERLGIENLSFRNEMVSLRDRVQQLEEEKEKQDTVLAVRTSSPHLSSC